MIGKSGLLENSVFWRRRGARNPYRLKKCGWGAGCGGGHWGWSSESENQEPFVLYLICSDKQLSTQGGPAWLSTSWSFQAGEAPPPLVPTAPGTHQPSALVHFHFHCRLTSLFPMRQWLFEERVSFHFAHHPPPPNFWAMIKLVSTRRLDQSTLNIYYLQPTEHLGKPRYLKYLIHLQCGRPGFNPWVGKISWRRE